MTRETHASIGFLCGVVVGSGSHPAIALACGMAGAVAATLPDSLEAGVLPHRKPTHTLAAVLLVYALLSTFQPYPLLTWTITSAYASHLLADSLTKSGIWWLWPMPYRLWLLPKRTRLTTSKGADHFVGAVAMLAASVVLLTTWLPYLNELAWVLENFQGFDFNL